MKLVTLKTDSAKLKLFDEKIDNFDAQFSI